MRILSELKKKYNKWLFQKYGFNRGELFNKIPKIFLMPPLFSPSLYSYYESQEIMKSFVEGLKSYEENIPASLKFIDLDILEKGIGIKK